MEQATKASAARSSVKRTRQRRRQSSCIALGIVVAPRLARDVSPGIAAQLADDLRRRYGATEWRADLVVDRLVTPPASITELVEAARRKLLERDWDLGVAVTDLPLKREGRPIARHISPTHGIAVISLPALGAIHLRHRLRRTLVELVSDLVGDLIGELEDHADRDRRRAIVHRERAQHVLSELATHIAARRSGLHIVFVIAVLVSHLRLLLGMVRANRPWRLAVRLYAALVAALAASIFGVVDLHVWQIAATMAWWRLTIMSITSISLTITAVIVVHGLWERAPDPRVREQVVLFNIATAVTVAIGILCLYVALFVLILAASALVISPDLLTETVHRRVRARTYLALAWFVSSLATVGGALGAGLESDEAVREAAYAASATPGGAGKEAS
ncbi:MAG: hypothetical protein ACXVRU_07550 [Gaiellaceae bacterium]